MSYHAHGVSLTRKQGLTLLRGGAVRLRHAALGGPHPIHLTSHQLRRMARAHDGTRGYTLKLSPSQLRYNVMRGGGFLSDLWSSVKEKAPAVLKNLGNKALEKGLEMLPGAMDKIGDIARDKLKLNHDEGAAPSFYQKIGNTLLNKATGHLQDAVRIGAHKAQQKLGKAYGHGVRGRKGAGLGISIGSWKL
jgi:hypothetical protein